MKKKPRVKKGSSLVVILMIFSILTILGTSMLSLTLMSYKKRSAEAKIKSNLYMSESGLSEAYSIVGKYTEKAFEEGSINVENELAILLDKVKDNLGKKEEEKDPEISKYIDSDGNIIPEEIEAFKEEKFGEAYKKYILDNSGNLTEEIKDENNYTDLKVNSGSTIKPKIDVTGIEEFSDSTPVDPTDEYTLNLQSTFNLDNFEKTIQTTYVIKIPKYSNEAHSANEIIKLSQNPVWSKAICADGDMKIKSGTVNVTGDIYIKGEGTGTSNPGIILERAISNLTVTGDVSTAGNLETNYDTEKSKGDGSKIQVYGNIYAENIIVSKKETEDHGSEGSSIKTDVLPGTASDGSLYVMDDMEVNAEKSIVNIFGGFYGVSEGSQAVDNNPDNSSSIIVNAEDIGETDGSTIDIGNEAYIAGSAYISGLKDGDGNDYKYQTGESESIKGNYRAYTQPLLEDGHIVVAGKEKSDIASSEERTNLKDDVKSEYFDPLALISKYRYFVDEEVKAFIEKADDENETTVLGVYFSKDGKTKNLAAKNYRIGYDILNVTNWTEITPLESYVEIPAIIADKTEIKLELLGEDGTMLGTVKDIKALDYREFNIFNLSVYFKDYYTDYNSSSDLNLGRGINIGDIENSIYLGSIFSKDTDEPVLSYNYDDINIDKKHDEKIRSKRNELKNQLFYMGFYNKFEDDSSIEDIADNIKSPQITIESQVNFASSVFDGSVRMGITDNKVDASREIILLNGDATKSYAFIEKSDSGIESEVGVLDTDTEKIYYKPSTSGTTFNGIIVTKGDLYLSGNINFTGTVICGGTIYFTDNTVKTFKYDKFYLNNLISTNYSIFKSVFENPLSAKNDIYIDVFDSESNLVKSSMLEMRDWVIIN